MLQPLIPMVPLVRDGRLRDQRAGRCRGAYWDYNAARRGVLFAPVRFQHAVYSRPGYSYTPSMVISLDVFLGHLFVRPTYGHCYFGDYYYTAHSHGSPGVSLALTRDFKTFDHYGMIMPPDDKDAVYYGAADTCVCLATASVRELLKWLERHNYEGTV